ncbi:uncharacterized protein LOC111494423 isoform X2 [Cucurbita maxima]|uniref:Uncharacterized protein LOC111494423 isoform X2 n=1 Tax=Cucurbita maxima TaxID=3661 RepID=A0A6J1KHH8_CUCMA|nr:uncharacterized protein LOC111494423 isoform X2 [Cucurbita maxima]
MMRHNQSPIIGIFLTYTSLCIKLGKTLNIKVSVRASSRIPMLKPSKFPLKKCLPLQIRSSINKIFEDQAEGVICYTDENGEIVCEGYDEGPRLHQNHLEKGNHHRESEILDLLLKQNWINRGKGGGGRHAEKGVLNVNGFNSYY